jgi:hypothetical protein
MQVRWSDQWDRAILKLSRNINLRDSGKQEEGQSPKGADNSGSTKDPTDDQSHPTSIGKTLQKRPIAEALLLGACVWIQMD